MKSMTRFRTLLSTLLLLSLASSSFGLVSCSTDQVAAAGRLTLEAKLADALVQSGAVSDTVITADLSEVEIDRVITAIDAYTAVRAKWQVASNTPVGVAGNILALTSDYDALFGEYQAVKAIVQAHWAEYTPAQQVQLAQYHARAVGINESVVTLLADQKRAEAVGQLLDLGLLIAQVAVL